jgi:hypothetical protein
LKLNDPGWHLRSDGHADLEIGDTAGLETCATVARGSVEKKF